MENKNQVVRRNILRDFGLGLVRGPINLVLICAEEYFNLGAEITGDEQLQKHISKRAQAGFKDGVDSTAYYIGQVVGITLGTSISCAGIIYSLSH